MAILNLTGSGLGSPSGVVVRHDIEEEVLIPLRTWALRQGIGLHFFNPDLRGILKRVEKYLKEATEGDRPLRVAQAGNDPHSYCYASEAEYGEYADHTMVWIFPEDSHKKMAILWKKLIEIAQKRQS